MFTISVSLVSLHLAYKSLFYCFPFCQNGTYHERKFLEHGTNFSAALLILINVLLQLDRVLGLLLYAHGSAFASNKKKHKNNRTLEINETVSYMRRVIHTQRETTSQWAGERLGHQLCKIQIYPKSTPTKYEATDENRDIFFAEKKRWKLKPTITEVNENRSINVFQYHSSSESLFWNSFICFLTCSL